MPTTEQKTQANGVADLSTSDAPNHSPAETTPVNRSRPHRIPVSIVILTLNEEINIVDCLKSCAWCDDVHVLDSGSNDQTQHIARQMDAKVYEHPFVSFGKQRNWAIDNIPTKYDWIFHLDADERFTDELVEVLDGLIRMDPQEAGFHIPSKTMFMGRWLKHAAGYPTYQMRLFHKQRMRFIDYGHGQREDNSLNIGIIKVPYLHYSFSKGIYDWLEKHNRYSTLEALQVIKGEHFEWRVRDLLFAGKIRRWRAWKELSYRFPFRAKLRWIGVMLINLGFLEGRAGLTYANLMALYENMIINKLHVLRSQRAQGTELESIPPVDLDNRFDSHERPDAYTPLRPTGDALEDRHIPLHPDAPPTSRDISEIMQEYNLDHLPQMQPESSPWSFKGKAARTVWMLIGKPLFRYSFHNWYRYRRVLLRLFGATIGKNVAIRPSAHIEIPWMLTLEDGCSIGDKAILYSLGQIRIGKRAIISQYSHLCAGTHDYTDHTFKLLRTPVAVGDDCWIGADSFIGPGVTVGALSVVGARSSVYKDVPPGKVAVGNPAKVIKDRQLN